METAFYTIDNEETHIKESERGVLIPQLGVHGDLLAISIITSAAFIIVFPVPFISYNFHQLIVNLHVVITLFRTHLNYTIHRRLWRHSILFLSLIFIGCYFFELFNQLAQFIRWWWDPYHTSMQIFGLARIYEMKYTISKNINEKRSSTVRRWDRIYILYLFFYPFVIFALNHPVDEVLSGIVFLNQNLSEKFREILSMIVHGGMILSSILYFSYFFYRPRSCGGPIHFPKMKFHIILYSLITSILLLYMDSFRKGMMVTSIIHTLVYILFVFNSEVSGKHYLEMKIKESKKFWIRSLIIVGLVIMFVVHFFYQFNSPIFYTFILTFTLFHFWVDGKVWSVRAKDVF
jgi:hypothetical protein